MPIGIEISLNGGDSTVNLFLPFSFRIKRRDAHVILARSMEMPYWDSGAPAYRWNQIAPELLTQKFDVVLRVPASWMNIAIYDATILAWKEKLKYKRKRPQVEDTSLKPFFLIREDHRFLLFPSFRTR